MPNSIPRLKAAIFQLKGLLPTAFERLVDTGAHLLWPNRKKLAGETSSEVFNTIYREGIWEGGGGSRSGLGSTHAATAALRQALPAMWARYGVRTVLDAPCGDWSWMKDVDTSGITYLGCDIVQQVIDENNLRYAREHVAFRVADITRDQLPAVDLVICKDCLQHLSYDSATKALQNFKRSGSRYLLTTSYRLTFANHDIRDGGYRALNLMRHPFFLPRERVLDSIQEAARGVGIEPDKCMYLWKIDDLPV